MNQPSREELLEWINEIIEEELGTPLEREEQLLIDCGIDSFGYAMFWLSFNAKLSTYFTEPAFPNDKVDSLDYQTLTITEIIDKVLEHFNNEEVCRSDEEQEKQRILLDKAKSK